MLGRNIKKFRLLKGYSLRDMADKLEVSHQTIKKYEDGSLIPNSSRLIEIAEIFNVNISDLVNTYDIPQLQYVNYRKNNMSKQKENGLKMLISDEIGKYLEILQFANEKYSFDSENWSYTINSIDDIDDVAKDVRYKLGISNDNALDNLVDKLEDNNFLILEINFEEKFDGFCEYVDDLAFIILSSKGYERNRFTLAHELGHLILKFDESKFDEEKVCDKFASVLLMPSEAIKKELSLCNRSRNLISIGEVLLLAREYKVSPQAVVMRLYDLNIIDEYKKKNLFILLNQSGYRTKQLQLVDEHPTRRDKIIFRLEAEKIISQKEAINYLGVTTDEYFKLDFSD